MIIFTSKNKGFTLLEFLIYIAIFSVVLVVIVLVILWSVRSNIKVQTSREVFSQARRAIEIISQEIREADDIYEPASSSSQLSLITKKYLPSGENSSYVDFFVFEGRLCLKKESSDPVFLTSNNTEISNLVFTKIANGQSYSLDIDLTVDYKNPANRPEYQSSAVLSSVVSLRR